MPLTPAQRQKNYREKLKREDPDKYEEIKRKSAENAKRYYREKVSQYTEDEKESRRQQWRDATKQQKYVKQDERKMPLTAAQRQKRFREKLKREDPDKYKEIKRKSAENAKRYYREKVSQYTEDEKESRRQQRKVNHYKPIHEIRKDNKRFQLRIEQRLRKQNREFKNKIISLDKELTALKLKYFQQSKQLRSIHEFLKTLDNNNILNREIDNSMKQTDIFNDGNIQNIDPLQQESVKEEILEDNVSTASLSEENNESLNTEENTLEYIKQE